LQTFILDSAALRGKKPRVIAWYLAPEGEIRIVLEDATTKEEVGNDEW
jgi:hypothetical protein